MPGRVDFFVAGVQKAGTTALDTYLRAHLDVQMASRKEVHHFDDEQVDWRHPDHGRLHACFDWTGTAAPRGESTPIYLYWPRALERLHRYNPFAKLIILLRHPAWRAISHWKMETARGYDNFPLDLALSDTGRLRVSAAEGGVHRVFSYVERGFYAPQIERLLGLFPRRQVHFLKTADLWRKPEASLASIALFLGAERKPSAPALTEYIVPIDTSAMDPVPAAIVAELTQKFRADIEATASLTGLDLSPWLSPEYAEPLSPAGCQKRVGIAA
jgi:hypothetical protein